MTKRLAGLILVALCASAVFANTYLDGVRVVTANKVELLDVQWEDLRMPATAINPPGQVSDPDWDNTNVGWLFDKDSTETLQLIAQLPHGYREGEAVSAHIHWQPTSTNGGNVVWHINYQWLNNGETQGAYTEVTKTATGNGTSLKLQIDSFSDWSKSGALVSSVIIIKLSRDGAATADTYTADALLKEFDIHYPVETLGSDNRTSK